jgi:hypothetical protein
VTLLCVRINRSPIERITRWIDLNHIQDPVSTL